MDHKPHARSHGYSTDNANPTRSKPAEARPFWPAVP